MSTVLKAVVGLGILRCLNLFLGLLTGNAPLIDRVSGLYHIDSLADDFRPGLACADTVLVKPALLVMGESVGAHII
jgi:hypothetical protein